MRTVLGRERVHTIKSLLADTIHPSGAGLVSGSWLSKTVQTSLSPVFQLLLVDPEVFLNQMRYIIYTIYPGFSYQLDMPKKPRRHQKGKVPQQVPFDAKEQQLYFMVPTDYLYLYYLLP